MNHNRSPHLLLLIVVVLLAACRSPQAWVSDNGSSGMVKASPTAEPVSLTNTVTPEPSATATMLPEPTPTPAPSATPVLCQETQGNVEQYEITAIGYREKLAVSIYLPPCYVENQPEDGYPYVILLHGQTYTDQQWIDIGLPETMDHLILQEEMNPFVVVMPFESPAYYDTFNFAITRNLVPWLAENLEVCDRFECRAIGGISRGGGWAMYSLFQEPGIFSALGLHSTPGFDNTPYYIRRATATMTTDQFPRIWVDVGAEDYWYPYAWNVKTFFDDYSITHEWHENEGGHDNGYWEAHLEEYLRWYGAGWDE